MQQRRSSWGVVILIVFVLGLFFVGGLAVVGVGVFMAARNAEVHRRVERQMAFEHAHAMREQIEAAQNETMAHAETAHAHAELVRTQPILEMAATADAAVAKRTSPNTIRVANREITLKLDHDGKIDVDGKVVALDKLKTLLNDAVKGRESKVAIVVKADKQCRFEHVAAVLSVCQDVRIPDIHITTLDD